MTQPFHASHISSGCRGDDFLPLGVGEPAVRAQRVREAQERRIAEPVLSALQALNQGHPARDAALAALRAGGAALVVTGQQVGLFLGPLYTLAKAASAIAWAKQLEAETGVRCLPLFWLQTEDHDFAEIDHCSTPHHDGTASLVLRMHSDKPTARISVAQRRLDAALDWAALAQALGPLPHAEETLALLRAHYQPGVHLHTAFAGLLQALFPELLVLDPRDPAVVACAAPVIARSLALAEPIDRALAQRAAALTAAGFKVQVPPREGSLLCFAHDAAGERYRPKLNDAPALAAQLAATPMAFSTSALLRPIVQDSLLPTALYVGGPAEVDYFAEVACLYPLFEMPPPLVAARARMCLVPARARAKLDALGLTLDQLAEAEPALAARLNAAKLGDVLPETSWLTELNARLERLAAHGGDPADIAKARNAFSYHVERLRRRHLQAQLTADAALAARLRYVRTWLRPDGAPQERVHGFVAFAALWGATGLRQLITTHLRHDSFAVQSLSQ